MISWIGNLYDLPELEEEEKELQKTIPFDTLLEIYSKGKQKKSCIRRRTTQQSESENSSDSNNNDDKSKKKKRKLNKGKEKEQEQEIVFEFDNDNKSIYQQSDDSDKN
ncbi:4704_t:CDS:2, partial [Dentiscutata erythropus]